MKTLEEIIERNDYKKISENLANKVEELADKITQKMVDLDIKELDDLEVFEVRGQHFSQYFLRIAFPDRYSGVLNICKNSTYGNSRSGEYFANDFNCWINFAKNKDALYFLNNLQRYLSLLDETETEKVREAEKALSEI